MVLTWVVPAGSYSKLTYDNINNVFVVKAYQQEDVTYPATEESLEKLKIKIDLKNFTEDTIKKPIAIPDTYQRVENKPKGIGDIAVGMVHGTIEAADIMVFIFVLGGMIGVINKTGSFNSGLMALARKTKGREFAIVFSVSVLMVLGGTTCGIEEEAVAFYPILVPAFPLPRASVSAPSVWYWVPRASFITSIGMRKRLRPIPKPPTPMPSAKNLCSFT